MEKPSVLVADDNEATCTLIKALLQSEFAVDVVTDGAEAVETLKVRQYSAILLDLRMPVMDGYGVLEFLERNRPDLLPRVLVVTAALSPAEIGRVRGYPICGVIAKPFEVDALLSAVRQCVEQDGDGDDDTTVRRAPILASGMILLLADLLRRSVSS